MLGLGACIGTRGPTWDAAESGSSGIAAKVSAALKAGEIMLLFLLSKAKEIEAVHIRTHIHTFFPAEETSREFSALATW